MTFSKDTSYLARLRRTSNFTVATVGELVKLVLNDLDVMKLDYQDQINALPATYLRKKSYTIGVADVSGCDYNFTSVANTTEQSIQLGATTIIPAASPVNSIVAKTLVALVGGTQTSDIGVGSGTDEYVAGADLSSLNAIASCSQVITPSASTSSVYFSVTPSANWSLLSAGKWKVDIFYIDNTL